MTAMTVQSIGGETRAKDGGKKPEKDKEKEGEEKREGTRSRSSSTSSEDYIIILPDCFDTSRPLGESMYRSVLRRPRSACYTCLC